MHGAVKVAMSVDVSMSKHGMTREGVMNYIPDWAIDKVRRSMFPCGPCPRYTSGRASAQRSK
jgi:hypothetical protein